MAILGFRCWGDRYCYVLLEGTKSGPEVIDFGHCSAPKNYTRPEELAWLREEIRGLVNKHKFQAVVFKAAEPAAQRKDLGRSEFEGVMQEAFHSFAIGKNLDRKVKRQLLSSLGLKGKVDQLEPVLSGNGLEAMNKPNFKEAALVAYCSLPD
ncbi:hypothetical protein KFF05_11210 [bacterium SCSIO 12827]|nr:hypothetical protein KFF05_11210 [bacterium SCSIO 12827]